MFKKGKGLLVLTLLVVFASIIIAGAQEVPVANSFRFPLDGDWSPLLQDFNKWNSTWNGYHLGEDVGREDADKKNYAVYPMADGVVKFADVVLGYTVIIEHKLSNNDPDGDYVCSVYYHMKRPGEGGIKLKLGKAVSMDSPIGYISGKWEDHKSSPHLHFGIIKGRYETGKDPRTGFWYYPGYTVIKKDGEVQKNPDDPIHKQILADWFNPSTDPKNGIGFIERHITQIEETTEISKAAPPTITSPLKLTPAPPYYYGDIIKAEFSIANRNLIPITFSVLTVGGRDPDNQVADFTHRQNITLEPSKSYNYQGTLTLNKVGDYHFFCAYQTPDGNWNTCIDLGSGLTDKDRTEDIVVMEAVENKIEKEISFKTFHYNNDYAEYSAQYPDWPNLPEAKFSHIDLKKSLDLGYLKEISVHMIISQDFDLMDLFKSLRKISEKLEKEGLKKETIESFFGTTKIIKDEKTYNGNFMEVLLDLDGEFFKKNKVDMSAILNGSKIHVLFKDFYCKENNKYFSVSVVIIEDKWSKYQNVAQFIINSMKVTKIEKEKLLVDSSLYHIECSKPIVLGDIFVVLSVNVSGPADELALLLTNPKGKTDIRFISKRELIDNFETVKLSMGECPLSEGPYILIVKTVTPEKVIYKKELWFTSPDVSIADAEFTYEIISEEYIHYYKLLNLLHNAYGYNIKDLLKLLDDAYGRADYYYFLKIVSLTLINNGDLPAKRDTDARALIILDGEPENMTLLTRPYKIGFYPPTFPTYIPNGKNKVPVSAEAMCGLKKGKYFVTITIPLMGGETISFKKTLTIE